MLLNRRNLLLTVPAVTGSAVLLSSCGKDEGENETARETTELANIERPSVQIREIDGVVYDMTEYFLRIGGSAVTENKLRIYEDLQCPYCHELKTEIIEDVQTLVKEEKLVAEFVVVNYLGVRSTNAWSESTANLLTVVADSQPDKFINVQKALYGKQPDKRNTDPFTGEQLREIVKDAIELTDDEIKKIDEGFFVPWVNEIVNPFAASNEVNSIPTVVWNETVLEDYNTVVDELAKL